MQGLLKLTPILASAFFMSACDPAFKTTAQKCAQGQELEIVIPVTDPDYQVLADSDEYELYLRQALEVMAPSTTEILTAEETEAKQFIDQQIEAFLAYDKSGDTVTGARNPIDFLEALIATTDESIEIESFVLAKQQLANAIADDDGFCSFINPNIRFVDADDVSVDVGYGELALSYNPFTKIVQQSILFSAVQSDLDSVETRETIPYIGFFQALPENYKANGFTSPEIRQAIAYNEDDFASLTIDEGTDTELGQILLNYQNTYCDADRTDEEISEWDNCADGITTRVPQHAECSDEANKLEEHSFDLNSAHTGLKRLRVEVDYSQDSAGQVRVYASDYVEAIYAADGTTVIKDPTLCEQQAVLDELAELTPGEGVRLTLVPDPNYDTTYATDEDGDPVLDDEGFQEVEAEPIAIYTYEGTSSAIRP